MSKKTCTIEKKENELTVTNFDGQRTKWVIGLNVVPNEFFEYFVDHFTDAVMKAIENHGPRNMYS